MDNQFNFKDFENVIIKSTYNIEIGQRKFEAGEIIAKFDRIQIAGLSEVRDYVAARGGFNNRGLVYWETTNEMKLNFAQGVFSKTQLSLLINSKLVSLDSGSPYEITNIEELESDENGQIELKYLPQKECFVYNKSTGEKLEYYQFGQTLFIDTPYTDVIVSYVYHYNDGAQIYSIGQRLINGFVSLEGRTRIKDDQTGNIVTGIIKIPKLKLMSDLSIRLGTQAMPLIGNFEGVAIPVGSRGNAYVSEICLLSDDIESDL